MLVVASALAVVHTKYRTRMVFAEIQRLQQELEVYDVELGQLQLEQNTWAEHGRVERYARSRLDMVLPARESILYIRP
ncbi:MAG: cell division protein FtsL [Pseudomonadota bacterium]